MITGEFVSRWSGKEYPCDATLDPSTGRVSDVQAMPAFPDKEGRQDLEDEYLRCRGLEFDVEYRETEGAFYVVEAALEDLRDLLAD